ncbi:hypothetical protein [Escherichia coli]|uniref:hypothetical protein n=1 Tax=Escherichia coli TaxID=562 RepID=UPI0003EE58C7|nr:hypothetical protein [Escherichia coli]
MKQANTCKAINETETAAQPHATPKKREKGHTRGNKKLTIDNRKGGSNIRNTANTKKNKAPAKTKEN